MEDITESADVGKGTFFNYFPSKDHILLAFGEMQLAKLESAVEEARKTGESMPQFLRSLGVRMTQEPTRHPGIIRTLLQAYLSTTPVRAAMLNLQKRVHALHTEIVRIGQERGEIRRDLPALGDRARFSANYFRNSIALVAERRREFACADGVRVQRAVVRTGSAERRNFATGNRAGGNRINRSSFIYLWRLIHDS